VFVHLSPSGRIAMRAGRLSVCGFGMLWVGGALCVTDVFEQDTAQGRRPVWHWVLLGLGVQCIHQVCGQSEVDVQ
jgi:hypothetical protein